MVLIGEAAGKIEAVLEGDIKSVRAGDMDDAVKKAAELAESGDTVVLSPACASFDMFLSFEDRGDKFKEAVKGL